MKTRKRVKGFLCSKTNTLEYMEEEAIEFLRKNEPEEGYSLAFSGGKDSIVTKKIAELAGVKFEPHYSCTGIDPPEVVKFIRQYHPDVKFYYPEKSFYQYIREKMPPLRRSRWCCDKLKKDPPKGKTKLKMIVGIRKEESFRRATRPIIDRLDKYTIHHKPIFNFLEWHIWELIEKYNLLYPSLYDEEWDRIGCVVCPFICNENQTKINRSKERWPGIYKTFEHAVKWWFYNKGCNQDNEDPTEFKTHLEYLEWWYSGKHKDTEEDLPKHGFLL